MLKKKDRFFSHKLFCRKERRRKKKKVKEGERRRRIVPIANRKMYKFNPLHPDPHPIAPKKPRT